MTRHLIHIGYPKTGSNFLRQWFSTHPQLGYVEGGIAGWRDVHQISVQAAQPSREILYRVTSSEGLATPHASVGQLTIDYEHMGQAIPAAQARVAGVLAQQFPRAKILVVTRGFRSMILSAYSQFVRTGGALDFAEYCNSLAEGCEVWNYNRLLDIYSDAFGAANVLALPYELLCDDLERFAARLEHWLGLAHGPLARERVNPALSAVELGWYLRLTRSLRALPLPSGAHRKVMELYQRALPRNPFGGVIPLLQRMFPVVTVTAESLPVATLEHFRGRADALRSDPFYASYNDEYLFT